jgi:Dynamin central region
MVSLVELTLGVLTKADTVDEGTYESWLKILNGKSHVLHLGYYATRLPAQKDMGQTWEVSREAEDKFFRGKSCWCKPVTDKNRLGTAKLTQALSAKLSQMIQETFRPLDPWLILLRLPTLKKDLVDKMRKVQRDFASLPKSFADDPQAHLLSLCTGFVQEMDFYTNGKENSDPRKPTFLHDALPHYFKLKDKISLTRPKFEIALAISLPPPVNFVNYEPVYLPPHPDYVHQLPVSTPESRPQHRAQTETKGTSSYVYY